MMNKGSTGKTVPDGMIKINQNVDKKAYQRLKLHAVEYDIKIMDVVNDAIMYYAGHLSTGEIKSGRLNALPSLSTKSKK